MALEADLGIPLIELGMQKAPCLGAGKEDDLYFRLRRIERKCIWNEWINYYSI
jgi:hypothetical protein